MHVQRERERERVPSRKREKYTRRGSDVSRFAIWRPCPGILDVAGPIAGSRLRGTGSVRGLRGEEGRLTAARASPPKSMAGTG